MRPGIAGLACVLIGLCVTAVAGRQQVFRSGTSAVLVDVFVTQKGLPVRGLTPAAFELRDNKILQLVTSVSFERAPISVTLVIEAGANLAMLARLDEAVAAVVRGLQPDDRCALITFGRRIEQVTGSLTSPVLIRRPADAGPSDDNGLAMNDAMMAALAAGPSAGRRQVVLLFSSMVDSASFLGWADVVEAAWRSPAMVQQVRAAPMELAEGRGRAGAGRAGAAGAGGAGAVSAGRGGADVAIDDGGVGGVDIVGSDTLSLATGGSVRTAMAHDNLGTIFLKAIDDARTSYVLSYTPGNVKPGGWHQVLVKVKKGESYTVRARQGYFGG